MLWNMLKDSLSTYLGWKWIRSIKFIKYIDWSYQEPLLWWSLLSWPIHIPLSQIETFNIFDNVEYILRIRYEDQVIIDITFTPIFWGNNYSFCFYLDSVPANSRIFFLVTGLFSILWCETVYFIDLMLTLAES